MTTEIKSNESKYLTGELRDPKNWTYDLSTIPQIKGVKLGEMGVFSWNTVKRNDNLARVYGTDEKKVEEMADDMQVHGIDPKEPPVFYNAVSRKISTGNHRQVSCKRIKEPDYMGVPVFYDDEEAERRFCMILNNLKKSHIQSNNDMASVIEHIKYLIKIKSIESEEEIKEEIYLVADRSLTTKERTQVFKKIQSYIATNGIENIKLERYVTWNSDTYSEFLESSEDEYKDDVISTLNCHYYNAESGTGLYPTLKAASKVSLDSYLNIQVSVGVPTKKQSLDHKRKLVKSNKFKEMSKTADNLRIYHAHHGHYQWEHPDCEHAFLAQDRENEDVDGGQFIRF